MSDIFRNITRLLDAAFEWADTLSALKFSLLVAALCALILAFLELLALVGLLNFPTGYDDDGEKITTELGAIIGGWFMAYVTRLDERP